MMVKYLNHIGRLYGFFIWFFTMDLIIGGDINAV